MTDGRRQLARSLPSIRVGWGFDSARFAGFGLGLLAGVPLVRALTGGSAVAYLLPLAWFACATLLHGATSGRILMSRTVVAYCAAVLLFVVWMAVTSFWAIPGVVLADDLQLLAGLLLFAIAATLALDQAAVDMAIYSVVGAALLGAFYVFSSYISAGSLRGYGALQGQYLIVARLVGLGTVLAVYRALTTRGIERRINVASALVLLGGLGFSLARGALLSVVGLSIVGAAYTSWLHGSDRRSFQAWLRRATGRLLLLASVLMGVSIAVGSALRIERTRLRLLRLFTGTELSEGGRRQMWRAAWKNIGEAPVFGHGLGSSGVMSGRAPDLYPHNWALQVWLDGGSVGMLLCLAVLALPLLCGPPWKGGRSGPPVARWLPLAAAYGFLLLEYSKSSNFYAARLLLVVGVLLVYSARAPRTT